MKPNFFLPIFLILFSISANATSWRVNNNSNYNGTTNLIGDNYGGNNLKPVFKEMSQVMSYSGIGATSGDTIYLEGSTNNYQGFTITKQLTIIGSGYFLTQNDSSSWNNVGSIVTNTGNPQHITISSSNVNLIGIQVSSIIFPQGGPYNNIKISRCYIGEIAVYASGFNGGISPIINDLVVTRNYFVGTGAVFNLYSSGGGNYTLNNFIFSNNIVGGYLPNKPLNIVNNNVFTTTSPMTFSCNEFKNNIIRKDLATVNITCALSAFTNNISASSAQFPVGYNNTNLVISESNQTGQLFINPTNINNVIDRDYRLIPAFRVGTSTPSNLGSDGTERGVYGGAYPYSRAGIGPIPVIYKVNTNGVATQSGLNVSISTKAVK
jgi:hypothetical protein